MTNEQTNKNEFLWKVFTTINDWLKFSDTKAVALLLAQGVVITAGIPHVLASRDHILNNLAQLVSLILGSIALLISIFIAVRSLISNFTSVVSKSIIFFGDIARDYSSGKEYIKNLPEEEERFNEEVANEIVSNSIIAKKKYFAVSNAIKLFIGSMIIFYLGIFSTFVGCNKTDNETNIGIILPLTGNLSFMGNPEKNGFELALEDYKTRIDRKHNVSIVFEDSRSTSPGAVAAAQKLVQIDKPIALIVANTGPNLAVAPLTKEKRLLHVAFCMEPDIQKKHDLLFRLYESATQEGVAILEYLKGHVKDVKGVGFLYIDQPNFVKTVEDIILPGMPTTMTAFPEKYSTNEQSFRPQLARLQAKRVEVLIILGYGNEYGLMFAQLKELGLLGKVQILGGWGFLYPQVDKNLLEGVRVAGPTVAFSDSAVSISFRQKYEKHFGLKPNFDAAYAYTALKIVLDAFNNTSSSDPATIAMKIAGNSFITPVGRINVVDRGLIVDMGIAQFRDGELRLTNQ
jgi:branched-chain amino acid transport system substrate-binding protein